MSGNINGQEILWSLENFKNFNQIYHTYQFSVVYTGFCVWEGGVPGAMGGTFFIGEIKNFAFFQTRKFSKNVEKSMKIV